MERTATTLYIYLISIEKAITIEQVEHLSPTQKLNLEQSETLPKLKRQILIFSGVFLELQGSAKIIFECKNCNQERRK